MSPKKQTILIVEDLPDHITLLHHMLGQEYRLLAATDGRKALEIAAAEQPDLILLDIRLPDMDGYEIITQLKAQPLTQQIPIVLTTALSGEADLARGLELGAVDYLTKPYSWAKVSALVGATLERTRAETEPRPVAESS